MAVQYCTYAASAAAVRRERKRRQVSRAMADSKFRELFPPNEPINGAKNLILIIPKEICLLVQSSLISLKSVVGRCGQVQSCLLQWALSVRNRAAGSGNEEEEKEDWGRKTIVPAGALDDWRRKAKTTTMKRTMKEGSMKQLDYPSQSFNGRGELTINL